MWVREAFEMTQAMVIHIGREAVTTVLLVAGPMLLLALGVGLLVSLFQATTQIQEQTLAFIPKIVAVLLAAVIFGPWMLRILIEFTQELYQTMLSMVI